MSKKKWLLAIIIAFTIAYLVYRANYIPQYTDLINCVVYGLTGTYNTSPLTIVGLVGGTVTTLTTGAKLLYDRGKSGVVGTYDVVVGQKDRQLEALNNGYSTLNTQYNELEGRFNTSQTELETLKTAYKKQGQQLADATTQLQRRQDEYNMLMRIEAVKQTLPVESVTVH